MEVENNTIAVCVPSTTAPTATVINTTVTDSEPASTITQTCTTTSDPVTTADNNEEKVKTEVSQTPDKSTVLAVLQLLRKYNLKVLLNY